MRIYIPLLHFFPINRKKGIVLLLFFLIFSFTGRATGDSLRISLLTCSPGKQVYELFGHTAIRVQSAEPEFDIVFNYGIFSFNAPHFLYRFTKGETDYRLDVSEFRDFILMYAARNSAVTEQELNLSPQEKTALFQALLINSRPENCVYRYNFLFDNCSSRAKDMILRHIDGKVVFYDPAQPFTFRQLIHRYTGRNRWLTFGIDLALGSPLDRPATYQQEMFLPLQLKNAFEPAQIEKEGGEKKTLVRVTTQLLNKFPKETVVPPLNPWTSPLAVTIYILLAIIVLSWQEYKTATLYRFVDTVIFSLYGLTGCILFFLMFISTHPATFPNYSGFWLHPFHLFAAIAVWVKSAKNILYYYHFANFAVLLLLLIGWHWIPQQFNPAFLPLILLLMVRSLHYILIRKKNKCNNSRTEISHNGK